MNHRILVSFAILMVATAAATGTELNGTLSTTAIHHPYHHRQSKSFRMDKSLDLSKPNSPMATTTNEISQFLNTKNIVKTLVKLVFGTNEESTATSRQVLNLLVKVLDMLKTNFHQRNARSRSATDERGLRDSIDDAAVAGISMMKGFVRSVMATTSSEDQQCVQRHICDAAAQATRESRELGSLIAQIGSYASSYVLDNQKSMPFKANYEAGRVGRNNGEMCHKMYRCLDSTAIEPEN